MEKWQRDHIRENFPELIHVTVTNVVLLAHLQASGVLSRDDVETIQGRSGSLDRAVKLYEIVQARTAAYGKLLEALRSCNQSGAANILQKGFQKYVSAHPDYKTTPLSTSSGSGEDESQPRFVKPVEGLLSYISEASEKRLILLSTPDPDLTLSKMDDTLIGIDVSVQTLSRWDIKSRWLKLKKSRQPANNGENVPVKVILNDSGNNKKSPITIDKYFKSFKHLDLSDYTRFVAVLPEKKEVLEQLKEKCMSNKILADKVAVLNDTFRWDHLSKTTQSKILKQTVIDQGRQVKLETVCRSYVYEDKKLFRSTLIKDKLLIDLLHYKEPPVIFRQTIPPVMEHYIRRRFRCRHRISNEVFKRATGNEIFVISGPGNLEELKRMAQECKWKIDMASSQLRKNTPTAHFILLESENQFAKLCTKFQHTHGIHLLKAAGGLLIWKKTEGDKMADLQASVFEPSEQMEFGEDATYDMLKIRNESEPFIICDAPGMGKTILLASLANKTRQREPKGYVVLFFVMTDFLTSVQRKFRDSSLSTKLDEILKEEIYSFASSYDLQSGTLLTSAKSKIFLFFDGLDEVPIDALDLAFQCFERIREIFPSSRIHVSTRPHLLHQVERAFRILGYNIQPFNEHDQTSFLTQYWSNYWVVNALRYNDEALIEYTKSCLATLKAKLSKKETDIAGIPLQCLLIGEVFEEEAMSYGDPENKRTAKDVTLTIHINSISELYDRMIERKFVSFERRCLSEASLPILKTPLRRLNVYLSIQTIFPDSDWATNLQQIIFTQNIVSGLKKMLPDWRKTSFDFHDGGALRNCIVRIGMLIGVDDGKLQFLHRTIAEHFLATYSTDFLTQNSAHPTQEIIQDFIDQKILETDSQSTVISQAYNMSQTEYTFKLPVVCSFINSIISGIPDIDANSSSVVYRSVNKEKIMRACIHDDHESILKLYFVHHKPQSQELLKIMLLSATRHSSTEIFDQIGYKPEMHDGEVPTLLHIAMERGSHPMETHLLRTSSAYYVKWSQDPSGPAI